MRVVSHEPELYAVVDLERWPAIAPAEVGPDSSRARSTLPSTSGHQTGIRVEFPDGTCFGPSNGPVMELLLPERFLARLGVDGKIGFGESYMAGEWDSVDLVELLEAFARHADSLVPRPLQLIRRRYEACRPSTEENDRPGAARNIARHYDLSNDLFAIFLDESMTYSAGLSVTSTPRSSRPRLTRLSGCSMRVASGKAARLLDIGTGWGELALRAARRGAQVTSLTLSNEQAIWGGIE